MTARTIGKWFSSTCRYGQLMIVTVGLGAWCVGPGAAKLQSCRSSRKRCVARCNCMDVLGDVYSGTDDDICIEVRNVTKRYEEHVAVRDLSLVVPPGAVYGLLGPNGAGKTTTIRMILNIIPPDSGTISVLGQPASADAVSRIASAICRKSADCTRRCRCATCFAFLAELKGVAQARRRTCASTAGSSGCRCEAAEKDWGAAQGSTSCRAACSRRCSSSARCCTIPIS